MPSELSPKQLRGLLLLGVLAVLAVAGKLTWHDAPPPEPGQPSLAEQRAERQVPPAVPSSAPAPAVAKPAPVAPALPAKIGNRKSAIENSVVRSVEIVDMRGRVVFRGDVDLAPTLKRIADGKRASHRNDGAVFNNYPPSGKSVPLLPKKNRGYYHEYVHPTPGISGPGPQRVILGQGGEIYYTPDHYNSFIRVKAEP